MKYSLISFFAIIFINSFFNVEGRAQTSFEELLVTPGNNLSLYSIKQTPDGGFIATGRHIPGFGWEIIFLRLNANGQVKWARTSNMFYDSYGVSVIEATTNNYLFCVANAKGSPVKGQVGIVRTDTLGNILNVKEYGNVRWNRPYNCEITSDSGLIIIGHSGTSGINAPFLLKLDKNHNFQWANYYKEFGETSQYSVKQLSDNGYIAAGKGNNSLHIFRTDSLGSLLWTKVLTIFNCSSCEAWYSLEMLDMNTFVIGGTTSTYGSGSNEIFLMKMDITGGVDWLKTYGSSNRNVFGAMVKTDQNELIISAGTNHLFPDSNKATVLKIDTSGNVLWANRFRINVMTLPDLIATTDSGFLAAGTTTHGSNNAYILKVDSLGETSCDFESYVPFVNTYTPTLTDLSDTAVSSVFLLSSLAHPFSSTAIDTQMICCNYSASPNASFTYSTNGLDLSISDSSLNSTNYYWDFGDGNTSSVQNPLHTYNSWGTYTICLTVSNECKSDVFCQNAVMCIPSDTSFNLSICSGDSVFLQGAHQNTNGTYHDTLVNVYGCDSIIVTTLIVNLAYDINDTTVSICSGDSALIYGVYTTGGGLYYDSLVTSSGCDSVHSTLLLVSQSYIVSDPEITICNGDSISIYGIVRNITDTYYDSLTSVNGCDSIHSTLLTLGPIYSIATPEQIICDGDSVMIFGAYQKAAGTYYDSSTTVNGCDSISTTSLLVNLTYSYLDTSVTICAGDSISIYGSFELTDDTYYDSLFSVGGCDSVRSTVLTVTTAALTNLTSSADTICEGDNIIFAAMPIGYDNYTFYVNTASVQSGPLNNYTSTGMMHGDTLVVIATNMGCIGPLSNTVSVSVKDSVIKGNLTQSIGSPLQNTRVYLIALDLSDSSLTAIDSTYTNGIGYYQFPIVNSLVYVKATPDSLVYPNEMPTYFDSSLTFQASTSVNVIDCDTIDISFSTIYGANPGGSGFMGGLISQGAGKKAGVGDHVPDLPLFLLNSNNVPVAHTSTDSNGYFKFFNIEYGIYSLWVDKPFINNGIAPQVTIEAISPIKDSVLFSLHTTWLELIDVSVSIAEVSWDDPIKIWPNPSTGKFTLRYISDLNETVDLKVFNSLGQQIFSGTLVVTKGTTKEQVDLHEHPMGVYIFQLVSERGVIIRQLIIE